MNYFNYNDNEIIYLIRLGSEDAYQFLNKKYGKLIYSKIKRFGLKDIDDSFQEGLIALYNAIRSYNENYDKSFNKYFEIVLSNRYLDIKRKKETDYEIFLTEKMSNYSFVLKESNYSYNEKFNCIVMASKSLTKKEKEIFDYLYIKDIPIIDLSVKINMPLKSLYRIIYKIKKKIKENVIK